MQDPVSEASQVLGKRLRDARNRLGFSQEQIALLAGMNVSNYGKIERGLGNPEFHTIVRLASVLNIDAGELMQGIRGDALPVRRQVFTVEQFVREQKRRGGGR